MINDSVTPQSGLPNLEILVEFYNTIALSVENCVSQSLLRDRGSNIDWLVEYRTTKSASKTTAYLSQP